MKRIYFKGIIPAVGQTIADIDFIARKNGFCLMEFDGWTREELMPRTDFLNLRQTIARENSRRIQELRDLCAVQKADGTLLKPFIWAKRRIDTYA